MPVILPAEDDLADLLDMAAQSVLGNGSEYQVYGVITEAFILHKQPRKRFTIFPQLFLQWKPDDPADARGALPDFGLGHYVGCSPYVRLQAGAEIKAPVMPLMHQLPPANTVANDSLVQRKIHHTVLQAQDQAKAAVKGRLLPEGKILSWLIFIGPYFTRLAFDPFTEEELITRGHRPNDSGDWKVSIDMEVQRNSEPRYHTLYLLGTQEAAVELEQFIRDTAQFLV